MFHDPSGLIIEIRGNARDRDDIMYELRKLTRDYLDFERMGHNRWRVVYGERPYDVGGREVGTNLIRRLINNEDHTVIIRAIGGGRGSEIRLADEIAAGTPGVGSSSTIRINVVDYEWSWVEGNRQEVIPTHIMLGHELIHALRAMGGHDRGEDIMVRLYPHSVGGRYVMWEDAETIGLDYSRYVGGTRIYGTPSTSSHFTENALRREHGLPMRIHHEGGIRRGGANV